LMWSALLRIFPGIFFFGWAVAILVHLALRLKGSRKAENGQEGFVNLLEPRHWRLIGGAVTALVLLGGASMASTKSPGEKPWASYQEFGGHTLKTLQHTALTNHMGLESVMVHNWDGRMRFLRNDNQDDPFEGWKDNRSNRFKQMKPIFFGIVLGLFAWTAWAMRRTKHLWVCIPLAVPLLCAFTNMTCYYFSLFITLCALVHVRRELGPPMLVTAGVSVFMLWSPVGFYWVDDRFVAQAYLFIALAVMAIWTYSRPFSMSRLKNWWAGKPDLPPKPKAAPELTAEPAE
jgi:hypothetical protein